MIYKIYFYIYIRIYQRTVKNKPYPNLPKTHTKRINLNMGLKPLLEI